MTTVFAAKTTTWKGASGANWNESGNWDNGVPESGDTVVLKTTDSVNDIAGLTLASLQFEGPAPIAISGESVTLMAGDASIVFGNASTNTIAMPLVLSAGDNKITLGTNAVATFSGVISGSGRPYFSGANVYMESINGQWNRKIAWKSTVYLKAENTFTGGFWTRDVTHYLSHVGSLGATWTEVVYDGYGPLVFQEGGDVNYHFTSLNRHPWFEVDVPSIAFNGNISNETHNSMISFIYYNAATHCSIDVNGDFIYPRGTVQGGSGNAHLKFRRPIRVADLHGQSGAFGGRHYYELYASSNEIETVKNSMGATVTCFVRDALRPTTSFDFTKIANGTTLDLNGYDQTAKTILAGLVSATYKSGDRVFTSSTPATLTLKPTADSSTYFSFQGAASLDWAPDDAKTLTLTNSVFTTTGRVKVSNGKLVLQADCACDPAMAVDLATAESLDIAGGQSLTVRALSIGGVPQWQGRYSFGLGELVVTSVEPKTFVWTGSGETPSAADPANWGGTAPTTSGDPQLLVFASGGSAAAFDAATTYAGLSFAGSVSDFRLTGNAALTLNECGIAVAAGHVARQDAPVAFVRKDQEVSVSEEAVLRTGAAISSDIAVTKTGVGSWIVEPSGSVAALSSLVLAAGDLRFEGGTSVAQALPPLTVSDFTVIRVGDGVTLAMETMPEVVSDVLLTIVTEGSGKVISSALKGRTVPSVILNGATLGFDPTTGVGGPSACSGTSIPARGGVIVSGSGTVTIDSDGDPSDGPITLGSAPATVGSLVQMTSADATVSLGGSTLTASSLVRTAGSGDLAFASGTVAAGEGGLTVENRDAHGEIAVAGTLSSAKSVKKIGEGALALSSAGSWSVPFELLWGTVALTGSDDARLTLGKAATDNRLSFTAAAKDSVLTLTHSDTDIGMLTVGGSTPAATSLKVIERAGTTRISGIGQIKAEDFDVKSAAGENARLVIADGAVVRFGVSGKALYLGGETSGAGLSEVIVTNALLTASSYSPTHKSVTDRTTLVGDAQGDARLWIKKGGVYTNSFRLGYTGHVGAMFVDAGAQAYSCGGNAKDYSGPRYTLFGHSESATDRGLGYAEIRAGGLLTLEGATAMTPPKAVLADGILAVFGGRVESRESNSCPFFFAPGAGHSTLYVAGGAFTNRLNYPVQDTNSSERGFPVDSGTGSGVMTACDSGEIVFQNAGGVRFRRNAAKANTRGTVINANDGGVISWRKDGTTSTDLAACLDANDDASYCPVYLNLNGGIFRPIDYTQSSGYCTQTPFVTFDNVGGAKRHSLSRITVFGKGGTIQSGAVGSGGKVFKLTQEIDAPTGQGVVAVPWTSRSGFIAAPSVVIEGDGYGASAFALFDAVSGCVTNITVTSPGCDYTEATAVVRYAATEVARIPCTLADNVGGALTFGADRTYATAPRAWTVSEIVLDRYFCLQKDNILTNTLVTMNPGSSICGYDDWFTGNNNTIRLRAIRGTGGSVVAGKAGDARTDNTVHVRELSLDGVTGVDFGKSKLSVEGVWQLDANDLVDRRDRGLDTGTHTCNVVFGQDSAIALVHPDSLREEDRRYVLFESADGYSVTGAPRLSDDTVLPEGWKLRTSAKTVKLCYSEGLLLIVR